MAGRPRLYANSAEKNRAYRERQEKRIMAVDRLWAEQSIKDMRRLIDAVHDAQRRGEELALSLRATAISDLVEDLALYFETATITPKATQPTKRRNRNDKDSD
jgi:hypothetical protein